MATSKKQTSLFTEDNATYSPEDSRVNHIRKQVSDLEKKMTDTSGRKCLEQYWKFSRNGLWAKTFSELLIGMEGWYSTRCRLIWKLKGTKYNRMYFQLAPSTHRTEGIGFGLLPTVTQNNENMQLEDFSPKLLNFLLKTPTAMDGQVSSGKKNPVSGNSGTLAQEIMSGYQPTMEKLGLLPTPTARDYRGTYSENSEKFLARQDHPRGVNLVEHIQRVNNGKTFQLNPMFVGEMMGFPVHWTELPFQNGEKKA